MCVYVVAYLHTYFGCTLIPLLAVKVPQIVKILRAGSVQGLSLLAVLLEVCFGLFTFTYNFAKEFPFSTYGESALITFQVAIIASLIFSYRGNTLGLVLFLVVLSSLVFYLCSGLAPLSLLSTLQSACIPLLIISRSTQILATFRAKTTGQLSFITCFMLFGGSMARVFTTMQETGDLLMLANYLVGLSLNATIVFQFILYWNADSAKKDAKKTD
jgi:mannose-P-dolichol utilization defect protein 1